MGDIIVLFWRNLNATLRNLSFILYYEIIELFFQSITPFAIIWQVCNQSTKPTAPWPPGGVVITQKGGLHQLWGVEDLTNICIPNAFSPLKCVFLPSFFPLLPSLPLLSPFNPKLLVVCCSVAKSCLTLCDPMDSSTQAPLSFTISWSLLRLVSIESVMPSNYLVLCHPLLLPPSIFSSIRVYS